MASTTPINGLAIPDDNSPNDPPIHFAALASTLDTLVVPRFATTTARDSAITAPVAGMVCSVAGVLQEYGNGAWGAPLLYGVELSRPRTTGVTNNSAENQGFLAGDVASDRGGFYNGVGLDILRVPANLGGLYQLTVRSTMASVVQARHIAIITSGSGATQLFRANGAFDDTAHAAALLRLSGGQTLGVQLFHQFGANLNNLSLYVSLYLIGR